MQTIDMPSTRKKVGIIDVPPKNNVDDNKNASKCPSWRWDRAKRIVAQYPKDDLGNNGIHKFRHSRSEDYNLINGVLPFCEEHTYRDKRNDFCSMLMLEEEFPPQMWALETYRNSEININRWIVEALICADLPGPVIAKKLIVPNDFIWWYEKMFFDVRAYLDSPEVMWTIILGSGLKAIRSEDYLWKSVGWKHGLGPESLLELISPASAVSNDTAGMIHGLIQKKMITQTADAVHSRKVNQYNENFVIDQYHKSVELATQVEGGEGSNEGSSEAGLLAFVKHLSDGIGLASYETEFKGAETTSIDAPSSNIFDKRRKENAEAVESQGRSIEDRLTNEPEAGNAGNT